MGKVENQGPVSHRDYQLWGQAWTWLTEPCLEYGNAGNELGLVEGRTLYPVSTKGSKELLLM